MNQHLSIFCIAMLLSACQNMPDSAATLRTDQQSAQKIWLPSQISSINTTSLQGTKMDWTQLPHAYAYMGCNQLNFQAHLDGKGGLQTGMMASTRMYCGAATKIENEFTQQISKMTHYRVENGHTLILNDDTGAEMRFVAQ